MERAVETQRESARPYAAPRGNAARNIAIALCLPLLLFSAYSLVFRPAFIWGPPVDTMPPQKAEASARVAMFLIAQRLDEYRATQGDYPPALASLDLDDPAITYVRQADTLFELRANAGGKVLLLRSTDDFGQFVSSAATPGNP